MNRASVYSALAPKVIPGSNGGSGSPGIGSFSLVQNNPCFPHQSAHYGAEDLLACSLGGSNGGPTIRIFDMNSLQLLQTLHGHRSSITALLWKPPSESCLQHQLLLFSGDGEGVVHLWDVAEGVLLSSIQLSCRRSIRVLSFFSPQHLLVLTEDATSFVFDAQLAHPTTLSAMSSLLAIKKEDRVLSHFQKSKLNPLGTFLLTLGGRLCVIPQLNLVRDEEVEVRDFVPNDSDVEVSVVDAFFSEAVGDLLYFATSSSIELYDWKSSMILEERIFKLSDGVSFLRIYPSSPEFMSKSGGPALPLLYSFGSDQRLVAWYPLRSGKFTTVSMDISSTRTLSKGVVNVVQSDVERTHFAVLFEDGSLSKWVYNTHTRRWKLTNFYVNPLFRPVCACLLSPTSSLCVGLENGRIAILDAAHNAPLRRFNLASFGNTKIVRVCGHAGGDAVWVVSSRAVDGRYRIQVFLLDTRSGEVVFTLRAPSATAEPTQVKKIAADPSSTYLLIVFWNCTFEVWNTVERRLIRAHAEFGVGDVSWAPAGMRGLLDDPQGDPQLLLVVFAEGAAALWSVYGDRVVKDGPRGVILNLPAGAVNNSMQSLAVGSRMVLFDAKGSGVVLDFHDGELVRLPLKDVPFNLGPVRCLSAPPPPVERVDSSVFTSNAPPKPGEDPLRSLAAVVFEDHSFGVWDTATGDRVGYSASSISGVLISAISIFWIGKENIAVLALDGAIYITHYTLRTVNSKFGSRALRRPMQNMAFLPPSHRIYLQSSIELVSMVDLSHTLSPSSTESEKWKLFSSTASSFPPPFRDSAEGRKCPSASFMILNISPECRPYRGPFGQIIPPEVSMLDEELHLYRETMVPSYLRTNIMQAYFKRRWVDFFYWVARLFGQVEKQRFWAQASLSNAPVNGRASFLSATARLAKPAPPVDPDLKSFKEVQSAYSPYLLADELTPYVGESGVLLRNRLALVEVRRRVFQRRKGGAEDAAAFLSLARELLKLNYPTKAVDLLLDAHHAGPNLNELSTLAVGIAAVSSPDRGVEEWEGGRARSLSWNKKTTPRVNKTTSFLYVSAKRAAAVHLARGEVEAAVEKYLLARDPHEASRVLQFQGRWHEAAALIKQFTLSTSDDDDDDGKTEEKEEAFRDILSRWAVYCGKVGQRMEAARIFSHIRDFKRALQVLSESANYLDIAGALAMALWLEYHRPPAGLEARPHSGKSTTQDAESAEVLGVSEFDGELAEAMITALADYSSVLSSVGNFVGEGLILEKLALLKTSMRSSPKRAP